MKRMAKSNGWVLAAVATALATGGCEIVLGTSPDPRIIGEGGGGSGGSTTSTSASSSTTGAGGIGGAPVCSSGETQACYSGPAGTEGVGICKGGTRTCKADGSGFGECVGEVAPQPETCATTDDEDCDGKDCAVWAALFGNLEAQAAYDVALDGAGNIFVVGTYSGSIALPNISVTLSAVGSSDVFVIKLDPAGVPLWAKSFGGAGGVSRAVVVATDALGNVVLGGGSNVPVTFGGAQVSAGIFVTKLTTAGELVWSKGLSGSGATTLDTLKALAIASNGDALIGGTFASSINFGDGTIAGSAAQPYGFVGRLRASDGSGKAVDGGWGRGICNGTDTCEVTGITLDPMGNVVLAGDFVGKVTMGTGATLNSIGNRDGFIGKMTAGGIPIWQLPLGGTGAFTYVNAVALDASGGPIIAGSLQGTADFGGGSVSAADATGFVARYGADKSYGWSTVLFSSGVGSYAASAVAVDDAGSVFTAGFRNTGSGTIFKTDVLVEKFSSSGAVLWSRVFGDDHDDWATGIALTAGGDPIVVGYVSSTIDFGGGPLSPAGAFDIFVAKLSR